MTALLVQHLAMIEVVEVAAVPAGLSGRCGVEVEVPAELVERWASVREEFDNVQRALQAAYRRASV